jgi:uncharacterized protein YndB with AHSA1/START domain
MQSFGGCRSARRPFVATDDDPSDKETRMPGTVRLHRVLTAPAERIYRAFLDPAAVAKWLPPDGFTCTVHALDAQVGGTYRMSFTNLTSGNGHGFGGTYLELVPGERIVHDDRFEDPNLAGTIVTRIELRTVSCGTDVSIVQEGIPDAIPVEQCYLGWQQSLELLKRLVEPTIPD